MENQSKPVLIPTDFTVVAQYAIEYAAKFAKASNASMILLHIVKKSADIAEATAQVEAEAIKVSEEFGIPASGIVREGSIFSTIGETVDELDAGLVFMGTHGAKGMQKLMGSWALKVIVSSKVPITVVQGHPSQQIERIAFPIDFKKENREKIGWVYYAAKLFKAKVCIFRTEISKDKKIEQGVKTNLVFTEKFLKSKDIEYDVTIAKGTESFAKEMLQFSEDINADLILITTTKGISIADFVLGTSEDDIISNSAHIPVMCVNPKKAQFGGFSATGG